MFLSFLSMDSISTLHPQEQICKQSSILFEKSKP